MEQQIEDCPFCGFKPDTEYQIMLHMESYHTEDGPSPFIVKDDDASVAAVMSLAEEEIQYAACLVEGCGEAILLTELDSHMEMHGAEKQGQGGSETESEDEPQAKKPKLKDDEVRASFGTKLSHALRNLDDDKSPSGSAPSHRQAKPKPQWKDILNMPELAPTSKSKGALSDTATKNTSTKRRLGKSELGPHANEKEMPKWLVKLLDNDGKMETINRLGRDNKMLKVKVCANHASDILPVIGRLLDQDVNTDSAYLCHPAVKHVSKLRWEGGFCGYRNIQMMCSYIIGVKSQGFDRFENKIPSIFDIQEYIEHAWDLGIKAEGRVETGGIRGTRKYIGTPEAQAMLCSLDISCDPQAFKPKKKGEGPPAYHLVFDAVQAYFQNGCTDFVSKVRRTSLPPIYFQHPGHSMTIVGFEEKLDGSKNLICFDPLFHDAPDVLRLVGNDNFKVKSPGDMLRAYRRGFKYLKKYDAFEILRLAPRESLKGNIVKGVWPEEEKGSEV